MNRFHGNGRTTLLASMLLALAPAWATEPAAPSLAIDLAIDPASATSTTSNASDVEQLRKMLIEQQRQIDELKRLVRERLGPTPMADRPAIADPNLGQVASLSGVIPQSTASPTQSLPQKSATTAQTSSPNPCDAPPDMNAVPPYLRLGSVCIQPMGVIDLTAAWRDKDAGSGLGSNFGSVPYNNTTPAKNSEFRFSPQNSRLGFRIDGDWKGTHFIAFNEIDFLGTSGSTAITVSNGGFVPRMRLFWLDARKGKIEFLAGQSWSMFTPNRSGISALPGDVFFGQVMDINYVAGLTWTRQPGMRVLFHPNDTVTVGFAAENPDQYIGGSSGGSGITLPAALGALASTQLDNAPNIGTASTVLSVPTVNPDFIAKLAFDRTSRLHIEVGGIERTFKDWNPNTGAALGAGQYSTKIGGGVLAGVNAEIFKNLRLVSTNSWGDGIGRYLSGQAPDLVVRSNGSLSLVHAAGTVDGFETSVNHNSLLLYAYYGGIYATRNTGLDANGSTPVGFGYVGSPNNQNRAIQEITFGYNQTVWRNPRYGSFNMLGQYAYLLRSPWYVAPGAPEAAHDNTIFFGVRYTLPGAMPKF